MELDEGKNIPSIKSPNSAPEKNPDREIATCKHLQNKLIPYIFVSTINMSFPV